MSGTRGLLFLFLLAFVQCLHLLCVIFSPSRSLRFISCLRLCTSHTCSSLATLRDSSVLSLWQVRAYVRVCVPVCACVCVYGGLQCMHAVRVRVAARVCGYAACVVWMHVCAKAIKVVATPTLLPRLP